MWPIVEMFKYTSHEAIDAANMRGEGSAMAHPSAAIRRDALLAIGGYRAEFEWAEDLDLFLRLAELGRLANLPDVLLTYRQHINSVGYSKRALQVARAAAAVQAAVHRRATTQASLAFVPADAFATPAPAPRVNDLRNGSLAEIHRNWAWLALIGGHPRTARKHAFQVLKLEPVRIETLRLVACALRGH